MRADFRFIFTDFRGAEAETHIYLEIAGGTSNLSSIANSIADIIEPVSDGFLTRADVTVEYLPQIQTQALLSSNIDRRLLFLCRDGLNIADFSLPSPRTTLPYQSGHPYAGIRITEQTILSDPHLFALLTFLYGTVDRYNQPIPQGRVVAGIMNNL